MANFLMFGLDENGRKRAFSDGDQVSAAGGLWTFVHQYYWDDGTLSEPSTPLLVWTGRTTTSSGTATFYVTDDGTSGGNALFSDLTAAILNTTPVAPSTADDETPFAAISSITSTAVTVVAKRGTAISLLGIDSLRPAADGTTIFLTVIGAA